MTSLKKRHYHVLTAKTLAGLLNFEASHGYIILRNTIADFRSLVGTDDGTIDPSPGHYVIAQEGYVALGYKPDEQ